jgi:hypothetical protein
MISRIMIFGLFALARHSLPSTLPHPCLDFPLISNFPGATNSIKQAPSMIPATQGCSIRCSESVEENNNKNEIQPSQYEKPSIR